MKLSLIMTVIGMIGILINLYLMRRVRIYNDNSKHFRKMRDDHAVFGLYYSLAISLIGIIGVISRI